jgi:hypothetical protein
MLNTYCMASGFAKKLARSEPELFSPMWDIFLEELRSFESELRSFFELCMFHPR